MNPVIFEIKEELKFLAKEIRRVRSMRKQVPNEEFECRSTFDSRLANLKYNYRIKHVAYCGLRGTSKELIEPTTHDKIRQQDIFYLADMLQSQYEAMIKEYENEETLLSCP